MKKNTSKLLEELRRFREFRSFYEENTKELQSLSVCAALSSALESKGLEKAKVVERSQLSEVYAYQILSGVRQHPSRGKVLCLTLAMGLTLPETQTLLRQTGYAALYAREPFDCVVIYGILHGLDVVSTNALLFEYTGGTLE